MYKIFDAHFHIIDPQYPLVANHGFIPAAFKVEQYIQAAKPLNIVGGAIVSGSFQKFDQTYLTAALAQFGQGYVGVTQLPTTATDQEIKELDQQGVRALRFNLKRGGSAKIHDISYLAQRVYDLTRWHSEFYLDSADLAGLVKILMRLPAISIDHLGLTNDGYVHLLRLVDSGAKIKASGFGRIHFDVKSAMREIHAINPDALMFGTDMPSTRAKRPFSASDIEIITTSFEPKDVEKILYQNAVNFYRVQI